MKGLKKMSKSDILLSFSSGVVMGYLGIPLDAPFNNPYRRDNKPSCKCTYYNGEYRFTDWTRYITYDIVEIYALNTNKLKFGEKLNIGDYSAIANKLYYVLMSSGIPKIEVSFSKITNGTTNIKVKPRVWEDYDLEYWNPISKNTLRRYNCFPLDSALTNEELSHVHKRNNPLYGYNKELKWKLYKPLDTTQKWRTNMPSSLMLGDSEPEVLCTSLKDAMVIHEVFNLRVATFQGESYVPNNIPSSVKHLIIDNDEAGIIYGSKMKDKYSLNIVTPKNKDVFVDAKEDINIVKNYGSQFSNC